MSEFGSRLKQAREGRGIALRQIAMATKISTVALEALERGDLSKLPGGIFSRAIVRAYAIEVGLNPDEVVEAFLQEQAEQVGRAAKDHVRPIVSPEDRAFLEQQRRAATILRISLVVVAVLIVVGIAAWQMSRPDVAADDPVQTPAPAVEVADTALRLELTATDNCWIQITVDGRLQPAKVLTAGQQERIEANAAVVLQVGSAGALTWTINGQPGRSLGRVGDVRTVSVTPETAASFVQTP